MYQAEREATSCPVCAGHGQRPGGMSEQQKRGGERTPLGGVQMVKLKPKTSLAKGQCCIGHIALCSLWLA